MDLRQDAALQHMDHFTAGDLRITVEVTDDPPVVRLIWTGRSVERQPERMLGPFFTAALARAGERKGALELDFQSLEHFNSSTIASLIELIQDARARGVRLAVLFDPSRKWQKLSFEALAVFVKADGLFELRPRSS